MNNTEEYYPDYWVVIEILIEGTPIRKVLAGWSGGYLKGDSWRVSSGITDIEETEDKYIIHNESGSMYYCHKGGQRLGMATTGVYNQIKDHCECKLIKLGDE